MNRKILLAILSAGLAAMLLGASAWGWKKYRSDIANRVEVPDGLVFEVIARDLPEVRQLALSADGRTLFAGSRRAGNVYRIRLDANGVAESSEAIVKGLNMPSGIALRAVEGREDLYVGALNQIWIIEDAVNRSGTRLLTDKLPDRKHHGWKYLRFGPDGALYVPVGAPCNVCESEDPRFASILRMNPDTGETELFASGIRNSVGLAFHPQTGALWFSENGRDMLGDDVPAEEINVADKAGLHFGFPYIHQGDLPDPEFGANRDPQAFVRPVHTMQAHVAPLGMTFNSSDVLGDTWNGALFVAEHGSWNRSTMVGYRVAALLPSGDGQFVYEPFVSGFLDGDQVLGRPNDVLMTPDGHLLVSDDLSGRIYRIRPR